MCIGVATAIQAQVSRGPVPIDSLCGRPIGTWISAYNDRRPRPNRRDAYGRPLRPLDAALESGPLPTYPGRALQARRHVRTRHGKQDTHRIAWCPQGSLATRTNQCRELHRAVDLPSIRGVSSLRGRALTPGELRKIAVACSEDASPAGPRDAAMLALGAAGGLRRSEIVALNIGEYDADTGALTIRRGKGPRVCYANVELNDDGLTLEGRVRA